MTPQTDSSVGDLEPGALVGLGDSQPPLTEVKALPEGWEILIDDDSGLEYYHNMETGEVQWEHPGSEHKEESEQGAVSEEMVRKSLAILGQPNEEDISQAYKELTDLKVLLADIFLSSTSPPLLLFLLLPSSPPPVPPPPLLTANFSPLS
eukprot:746264-Hanusia_phi.AAC.1